MAAGCGFVAAEYKMESLLIFESCWRRFEERYGLVSEVNPDRPACRCLQCVRGEIFCSTAGGCSKGATDSSLCWGDAPHCRKGRVEALHPCCGYQPDPGVRCMLALLTGHIPVHQSTSQLLSACLHGVIVHMRPIHTALCCALLCASAVLCWCCAGLSCAKGGSVAQWCTWIRQGEQQQYYCLIFSREPLAASLPRKSGPHYAPNTASWQPFTEGSNWIAL